MRGSLPCAACSSPCLGRSKSAIRGQAREAVGVRQHYEEPRMHVSRVYMLESYLTKAVTQGRVKKLSRLGYPKLACWSTARRMRSMPCEQRCEDESSGTGRLERSRH
eukprot:292023-Chlamydomonas_euryale.AAC.2